MGLSFSIFDRFYPSPFRMMMIATVSIFLAEVVVMLIQPYIMPTSSGQWLTWMWITLFDSALLVLLILPMLYVFLYRPMTNHFKERKELERRIIETSDEERRLIGYDLHDGVGQLLTGTAFMSKVLENSLRNKSLEEWSDASDIVTNINESIDLIKRLSRGLYPVDIDKSGLYVALKELASYIEDVYKIRCEVDYDLSVMTFKNPIMLNQLYLIAREAAINAAKHSKAEVINIKYFRIDGRLNLEVEDNGIGLPEKVSPGKGMGLHTMHYRADLLGGSLNIYRQNNAKTVVQCTIEV